MIWFELDNKEHYTKHSWNCSPFIGCCQVWWSKDHCSLYMQGWINTGTLNVMSITWSQQPQKEMLTCWGYFNQDWVCCNEWLPSCITKPMQLESSGSTKESYELIQCSSYPVDNFYVAWANQDHEHWLFTTKSWLWSFVYTRKPLRTAWMAYKRGSLHWSST